MDRPFFSIIIPTYNRRGFLAVAIDSVLRQTFPDFELIIIDDGSEDNSEELCLSFKDDRIRYFSQEHRGVSFSRNEGLRKAKGEYICFLDTDDRFLSRKLARTGSFIQKYPEYMIFHTEELWYRNCKILAQKKYHQKPEGNVFKEALRLCCISPSCACIKREVFETVGLFDETLPACEDYDFWLRATSRYQVKLIPEILTLKQGGHPDQLSRKYPAMDTFRIKAIKKVLAQGSLSAEQKNTALKELKNKCMIFIQGAEKRNNKKEAEHYRKLISVFIIFAELSIICGIK